MWCSDVSLALACQPADEAAHVDCWNYLCFIALLLRLYPGWPTLVTVC